jgi:hypothetical protein
MDDKSSLKQSVKGQWTGGGKVLQPHNFREFSNANISTIITRKN